VTTVVPFANFDPETGQYTRSSWCDATSSDLDAPNTYRGLVADINGQYHDLVNGVPVNMPPRPSRAHNFDWASKTWVLNREMAWSFVRGERASLLQASDWTQMPDTPMPSPVRAEWAAYRQALRDITRQADPTQITWPTPPK
jgi:hypothetical protein